MGIYNNQRMMKVLYFNIKRERERKKKKTFLGILRLIMGVPIISLKMN